MFHNTVALVFFRAGQVRAGDTRERCVSRSNRLLHRAVASRAVGAHIPRGEGEHDEGEHAA